MNPGRPPAGGSNRAAVELSLIQLSRRGCVNGAGRQRVVARTRAASSDSTACVPCFGRVQWLPCSDAKEVGGLARPVRSVAGVTVTIAGCRIMTAGTGWPGAASRRCDQAPKSALSARAPVACLTIRRTGVAGRLGEGDRDGWHEASASSTFSGVCGCCQRQLILNPVCQAASTCEGGCSW